MTTQATTMGQQTMICCLTTGLPPQTLQLTEEAKAIEKAKGAQSGTVGANTYYFRRKKVKGESGTSDMDGLQLLKDYIYEYKQAVKALAPYPYSGGFNLAPAGVVQKLLDIKQLYEQELYHKAWDQWSSNVYPVWEKEAPDRMGSLYSKDDFPSLVECQVRFKADLSILPLAEKDQVARVTLISPESKDLLIKHAGEQQKKAVAELHKQIWKDFMAPLQNVVKVFNKDKSKVHESLLGNIIEIVELIPSYKDLLGDSTLADAAEEVKKVFSSMTTEDLSKSADAKKDALKAAQTFINTFEPYARQFE